MDEKLDPFSRSGGSARAKLVLLGPVDPRGKAVIERARSLQIEHVSPAALTRGISRARGDAAGQEASTLALLRRWFFSRKPDAGFVLTEFPATLLQARVFDEWLDARGEELDAAVAHCAAPGPVVEHYRTLGLLQAEAGASQ